MGSKTIIDENMDIFSIQKNEITYAIIYSFPIKSFNEDSQEVKERDKILKSIQFD